MDLTHRLRLFSGNQPYITDVLAETGNTNNYTAYATENYSIYSTSTFNSTTPDTVTGQSSDTTYATDYYATESLTAGVSFNWTVTPLSAGVIGQSSFQIKLDLSNISGGTVGNNSSVGGRMLYRDSLGAFSTSTDFATLTVSGNTATATFTMPNAHSLGLTDRYDVWFAVTQINMDGDNITLNYDDAVSYDIGIDTVPAGGDLLEAVSNSGSYTNYISAFDLYKNKTFFRFNTAFLGSTAIIEDAKIYLYTSSITNSNGANVNIYVPSGWPPTTGSSDIYNGTSSQLVTAKGLLTLTSGGYTEFSVSNTSLISTSSYTNCRLQVEAPSQPEGGTNTNRFLINLNGSTRPYMKIRYRL